MSGKNKLWDDAELDSITGNQNRWFPQKLHRRGSGNINAKLTSEISSGERKRMSAEKALSVVLWLFRKGIYSCISCVVLLQSIRIHLWLMVDSFPFSQPPRNRIPMPEIIGSSWTNPLLGQLAPGPLLWLCTHSGLGGRHSSSPSKIPLALFAVLWHLFTQS